MTNVYNNIGKGASWDESWYLSCKLVFVKFWIYCAMKPSSRKNLCINSFQAAFSPHSSLFFLQLLSRPPTPISHLLSPLVPPILSLSLSLNLSHSLSPSVSISHPLFPSITLSLCLSPFLIISHPPSLSLTLSLSPSQSMSWISKRLFSLLNFMILI